MAIVDTLPTLLKELKKASHRSVLLRKIVSRIDPFEIFQQRQSKADWYAENSQDWSFFANAMDPSYWNEAQTFVQDMENQAREKLKSLNFKVGGGGSINCVLMYYLIRKLKLKTIVETGVAAGYSSQTILTALERNGEGVLLSSDFPYFRMPNHEQYVGVLVEPSLKHRWKLYRDGDHNNLSEISKSLRSKIDLFHYDSDKSYKGRRFAVQFLEPHFSEDCIMIFDDIIDNPHFHDFVVQNQYDFRIMKIGRKFIGITTRQSPILQTILPKSSI